MAIARTRCPLISVRTWPSGTRPMRRQQGGQFDGGPVVRVRQQHLPDRAQRMSRTGGGELRPGVRSSSSASSTSSAVAARAHGPRAEAQAAQGQEGRGSPSGAPVPSRVSSTP